MLTEIDVDQKPPGLGMAGDSQSTLEQAEKDIDELAEFDDEDEEDDTGFQVRDPLKAPKTNVFTTKDLHCTFSFLSRQTFLVNLKNSFDSRGSD